jgi:AraC-like DNA-binding protein
MKKINILKIEQFHDHDATEDFYANTLQNHLQTRHKDISMPHKHNFYLAVLFTKGSGTHEVDFRSYEVKPGALFFLNPGQTHHWELSDNTEGYIFFHTQGFYDLYYTNSKLSSFPFYYSIHNSPCVYLNNVKTERIKLLFAMLLAEYTDQKILNRGALASLADLIYIESTRIYILQNPSALNNKDKYYGKFRKFEELIEKYYLNEKSPSAYAEKLSMTSKHLNRITQAVVGKTASDVILERVMLEAKKEIILQRHGFAEIAYSLGYEDYAYFSKLFRKKTGTTPSGFLKRY